MLLVELKLIYIRRQYITVSAIISIKPAKILVTRTDRIGDVVLSLPVADVLRLNYPDSEIHYLVKPEVSELIKYYPNINKVNYIRKVTVSAVRELCNVNKYDLCVVLYPDPAIALGIFLSGVSYRLGTGYRWYSALFNIRHYEHRKYSIKHEVEYNVNMLSSIGCTIPADIKLSLNVTTEICKSVNHKLSEKGINENDKFIVIHIPTGGSAEKWSDANFTLLINMLLDDNEISRKIVLSGTADDSEQICRIVNNINPYKKVYPVLDLNLPELAGMLKRADLILSNSTGPIHIAAAVGIFVIGLYPNIPQQSQIRWGPYTDRKKIFTPSVNKTGANIMDSIYPKDVYICIKNYLIKS
jgi:heptosyltransferase-3